MEALFSAGMAALIAARPRHGDWLQVVLVTIPLAALLIVGAIIIQRVRAFYIESPETEQNLLAEFQKAYDSGEMDEAEFRRIRDQLLRSQMPLPPDSPARQTPRTGNPPRPKEPLPEQPDPSGPERDL